MPRFLILFVESAGGRKAENVIHVNVNLVQMDAVVTDRQGNPVNDLRADACTGTASPSMRASDCLRRRKCGKAPGGHAIHRFRDGTVVPPKSEWNSAKCLTDLGRGVSSRYL